MSSNLKYDKNGNVIFEMYHEEVQELCRKWKDTTKSINETLRDLRIMRGQTSAKEKKDK